MATKKAAKVNGEETSVNEETTPVNDETTTEETTAEITYPERSEPVTVAPLEGGNALMAKWRGVFHVLGGRVERWDITPEGVVAVNFTTNGRYDPAQVIGDLNISERQRLPFLPTLNYFNGEEPEEFVNPLDMTKWMQSAFTKVKTEEGERSPEYVKNAIAEYKKAHDFPRKKGRPRKIIRVENLGNIDDSVLAGVDATELHKLAEKIQAQLEARTA